MEECQRADWHLKQLTKDLKLVQVRYKGLLVHPGKHIASQCVSLAGVQGFLRFWPNGYYNFTQSKHFTSDFDLAGLHPDSWCAVGLFMPPGTHFKMRFFVGEEWSEPRECYWSEGSRVPEIWTPDAKEPPANLEDLVVGVEVVKNCRHLRPQEAKPLVTRSPRPEAPRLGHGYMRQSPRENPSISPPRAPRAQKADVNGAVRTLRTDLGLALPSPRFMCAAEMRRMPPLCDMARSPRSLPPLMEKSDVT
jgi:hypothetical protein